MKYLLLTTIFLIKLTAAAQSPYLSILVKMDSVKAGSTRYKIEMKICDPNKKTERGNWFTRDTSTIDFGSLISNDINCAEYFDKGTPTLISGEEEEKPFNQFQFNNHVFAWEKIFVFKISNWSSRGLQPEMYIVIPMKYKSFVTNIALSDIEFQPGKVIFLTNYKVSYTSSQDANYLSIDRSLKNEKAVDVKIFPLKELLEKN